MLHLSVFVSSLSLSFICAIKNYITVVGYPAQARPLTMPSVHLFISHPSLPLSLFHPSIHPSIYLPGKAAYPRTRPKEKITWENTHPHTYSYTCRDRLKIYIQDITCKDIHYQRWYWLLYWWTGVNIPLEAGHLWHEFL